MGVIEVPLDLGGVHCVLECTVVQEKTFRSVVVADSAPS